MQTLQETFPYFDFNTSLISPSTLKNWEEDLKTIQENKDNPLNNIAMAILEEEVADILTTLY
jgi:hypothetical protein